MSILAVHQKGAIVFLVDSTREEYSRFQFASISEADHFLTFIENHPSGVWVKCDDFQNKTIDESEEKG